MDPMKRHGKLEKLYEKAFHPDVYVETYYGYLDEEVGFFLRNLHDFFAQLETKSKSLFALHCTALYCTESIHRNLID